MMGTKPSWPTLPAFWGSVTPSYRRTATYIALAYLPLREGGTRRVPPRVDQRAQCEGLEGLAQLSRNRERRSSKNTGLLRTWANSNQDVSAPPRREINL